ncbi:hypothetical protein HS088_TW21G01080 [Tripterygium wilfordii]|uniref:Uncharacterized protein n=1 Tax=Tripterygium wilfordii TaxID=458696 RepID=A0A7J7C4R0_TRIWF|nr:hypothetical protein HS088_TW21G01080 [Tripterygium wilfordii]
MTEVSYEKNINLKKFKNGGFPLHGEQDKLWGKSFATGDNSVSPILILDNDFSQSFGADCYTPSPIDSNYDKLVDEFCIGSSPIKASTLTPSSVNTGGSKKRKKATEEMIDPRFDKLCQQLHFTSKKQYSYFATKHEYYDVKKVELVQSVPIVQPV